MGKGNFRRERGQQQDSDESPVLEDARPSANRGSGPREQQQDEKPRDNPWKTEEILKRGDVIAEIQSRSTFNGAKLYSVIIGRRIDEQRTTKFLRSGLDLDNLRDIAEDAQHWIDCDREEKGQNNKKSEPRQVRG